MQHTAIDRAMRYLEASFNNGYSCQIGSSLRLAQPRPAPAEVFSAILAAELLGPRLPVATRASLLAYLTRNLLPNGTVHFFEQRALLPADVDCTALLGAALFKARTISKQRFDRLVAAIVANQTPQGIIRVYFGDDSERAKIIDPVVAANALYVLNLATRGDAANGTEAYVRETLEDHWASPGSRYYPSPDTFLWCVARLVADFPKRYQSWRPLLQHAIRGRRGCQELAIELGQWSFAAQLVGVGTREGKLARLALLQEQCPDGSWPAQALFRYGRQELYFGSSVLSTTFALCALIAGQARGNTTLTLPTAVPLPPGVPLPLAVMRHHA